VAQHISELNSKVAKENTSARQLSNVILKDYSLTSKLLKLINSPYYGQVRGRITTVSRAVVLMGFESVRQAALGLLMFDHFAMQTGAGANDLANSVLSSLMSGLLAKGVAEKIPGLNKEEAFVCSMFRNLGKNLVTFYFPVKYQEIKKLQKRGVSEDRAVTHVLGTTFAELAQALGKKWGLPDTIIDSMSSLPKGDLSKPGNDAEHLRHIAAFSNDLADLAVNGDPDKHDAALDSLLKRFEKSVTLPEKDFGPLFDNTLEEMENYSQALNLGVKNTSFLKNVMIWNGKEVAHDSESASENDAARNSLQSIHPLKSLSPKEAAKKDRVAREKIMLHGVDEVAAAVSRHDDLNSIIMMVLETMYRGLELSRVVFALHDVSSGMIRARSGFGDDVDNLIRSFQFRLSRGQDLFHQSMKKGRDLNVDLKATPAYISKLPNWYKQATDPLPSAFLAYPVLINSFPAALFYGDMTNPEKKVSKKLLAHMNQLRTHAAKAIKRTLPRGSSRQRR